MKIRRAKKEDIPAIAKIYRETYSTSPYNEKWSKKSSEDKIKNYLDSVGILVAELNKEIKSFIIFYNTPWETAKRGEVVEFVVSEKAQRKGIGKELIKIAENMMKKQGSKFVVLSSHKKSNAFKFYKKQGYHEDKFIQLKKKLK